MEHKECLNHDMRYSLTRDMSIVLLCYVFDVSPSAVSCPSSRDTRICKSNRNKCYWNPQINQRIPGHFEVGQGNGSIDGVANSI